MQKIMIVEDDEIIASSIKKHLEKWNYDVFVVNDFEDVLEDFRHYEPLLVLLDISLPYYNGYYWCQEIRKESEVPIIFISSTTENMNIVMAMNMGADDFINKPFDLTVLTAKLQAILRRTYSFNKTQNVLNYQSLTLDLLKGVISYHEDSIELTKTELKIMQILFEHAGQIVSRDTIMEALWQSEAFVDDNTLSVNINRLRKKLDAFSLSQLIHTKKGIGYQLYYEDIH